VGQVNIAMPDSIATSDQLIVDDIEVLEREYALLFKEFYPPSYLENAERPSNRLIYSPIDFKVAVFIANARSKRDGLDTVYIYEKPKRRCSKKYSCLFAALPVRADYRKNGYRIPTPQEWEYFARAGSKGKYYWGEDSTLATRKKHALCKEEYQSYKYEGIEEPRQRDFIPNDFGLYHVLGNAREITTGYFYTPRTKKHLKDSTGKLYRERSEMDLPLFTSPTYRRMLTEIIFWIAKGGGVRSDACDLETEFDFNRNLGLRLVRNGSPWRDKK
jgi:hypothetical protein